MAIFVALIFQILFVFFAMTINIGLVVHDKINLQNSVDLAAYYAAQKQAEMLNAIAHQNYTIRQSWKLLTWRYRALGAMGIDRLPTRHPVNAGDFAEAIYGSPPGGGPYDMPACVAYQPMWMDSAPQENLCAQPDLRIPPLPAVATIAAFNPINIAISALSIQLRGQFAARCANVGAFNWWYVNSILHAFRLDQVNRKRVIRALAQTLSNPNNSNFLDLEGGSVLAGAQETFRRNLTFSNAESITGFEMFNSLQGVPVDNWLSEIQISPTLFYVDNSDTGADGCIAVTQPKTMLPARGDAQAFLQAAPPNGLGAGPLIPWSQGGPNGEDILLPNEYQFSLGFEKNPWYQAYVGVKASTQPRQIFGPFGPAFQMTARSFAKPFGGRIGPWYAATWPAGATKSSGDPIDRLLPPRVDPNVFMDPNDPRRRPNYSRFPGDSLGLHSRLALNSMTGLAGSGRSGGNVPAKYTYYQQIIAEIVQGNPNDILAWDIETNQAPAIRNYEISALAPDLFDITYYSIEPNFTNNYWQKINANKQRFGIPANEPVRGDLGSRGDQPPSNVQSQIELARTQNIRRPEAFYFVSERSHLLTAWIPDPNSDRITATSIDNRFGRCAATDDSFDVKNPGSCVAGGGRTGYSVKTVSRQALIRGNHTFSPNNAGRILNPPPANF